MKMFYRLTSLLLTLLISPLAAADISFGNAGLNGDSEPLPADQVFVLTTTVLAADMIRAEWAITDGYYLYRDKFKFTSNTPGISFGQAVYPKGQVKSDEFFGKMEIYHQHVAVDIPVIRTSTVGNNLEMTVVSQGCAEIGLCYPPQKTPVSLTLSSLPPTVAANDPAPLKESSNPLAALKKFGDSLGFGNSGDEFLPVDQAFVFSAEAIDGNQINAHFDIADGYYLYRDKFTFELTNADGISIGAINMPEGKKKIDDSFGEMIVYKHSADIVLPLNRTNLAAQEISLQANYQGCAEKGLCYPPTKTTMPISLPNGATAPAVGGNTSNASVSSKPVSGEPVSEQDSIAAALAGGSILLTIATFFGFGLLLAFTPCVFPMIPILSSIIVGQGATITTRRAFTMSLVYVLAMALTYTFAGVLAGLGGANLQVAFQNPWVLTTFAAIFVALAFSMFGFYDIQMPSFIQSRLTEISNRQQGGTLLGVAVMGLLSALIVGPCVAAPLAGALIYIGQTGDAVLGGLALFALSMGMGAPLLVIGTSAGKFLPKAGGWMDITKAVFGALMLAVAIWMLERILPVAVSMGLWAMLLICSAVYMGALEPVGEGRSGWSKLWKGLGLLILVYGCLILIGVAAGSKDVLQPLQGLAMSSGTGGVTSTAHTEVTFRQVKGPAGLDAALADAKQNQQYVMLDFYADWCVSCKEMEKLTFADSGVQSVMKKMLVLQADVTDNDALDQALMKKFGIVGPPSILFFNPNGEEQRPYRLVGFKEPAQFKAHLEKVMQ